MPRPRTSIAAACLAALGLTAGAGAGPRMTVPIASAPDAPPMAALAPALCAEGALPDGDACVRTERDESRAPEATSSVNAHHDKRGHWVVYDQIPRRPDRPADYDAYRYPVPCDRGCVVSGYDLDRPDDRQRRGRRLSHVGHGAVDLPQKKGTPIVMLALEHQVGAAEVVYVGPLFGTTVLTRHTLREGGQLRDYLLLFGHLDAPAPGLAAGALLKEGQTVGFVGDTGSPELVHLHLETRLVREGVNLAKLAPGAAIDNENSIVCDPRNVLPLR